MKHEHYLTLGTVPDDVRALVVAFSAPPGPPELTEAAFLEALAELRASAHKTDGDGSDCPCKPDIFQPCPECSATPGCWRCGGSGTVEPYDEDEPVVVVHRP